MYVQHWSVALNIIWGQNPSFWLLHIFIFLQFSSLRPSIFKPVQTPQNSSKSCPNLVSSCPNFWIPGSCTVNHSRQPNDWCSIWTSCWDRQIWKCGQPVDIYKHDFWGKKEKNSTCALIIISLYLCLKKISVGVCTSPVPLSTLSSIWSK